MMCPIEDRLALQDLTIAYCSAVDAIGDVARVTELFTSDAVYDIASLGLGQFVGTKAIGEFFAGMFPTMAHAAHYASNFVLVAYTGDTAAVTTYVRAYSLGKDGSMIDAKARYSMDCARGSDGWKIARLGLTVLIPD
jgi:ketosteroid isomerase-like protein